MTSSKTLVKELFESGVSVVNVRRRVYNKIREIASYVKDNPLESLGYVTRGGLLTILLATSCKGNAIHTQYPTKTPTEYPTSTAPVPTIATTSEIEATIQKIDEQLENLGTPIPRNAPYPTNIPTNTPQPTQEPAYTPTMTSVPTLTTRFEMIPDTFKKYLVEPDERRLIGYMSKEKIRETVRNNITKVVVTDMNGNEDALDVEMFAESLGDASFNFLAVKRLEATFYHPKSGECTETMERFDFDPPLAVQNFSPPYEPIGTGFLSKIKCEGEWKETQTQWSNAAPLESFFTWINGARTWHDLIFDKDGRQFVLKNDGNIQSDYYIEPPISRND